MFEVKFLTPSGEKVTKVFYNYGLFKRFVNKARHSKKITLISWMSYE